MATSPILRIQLSLAPSLLSFPLSLGNVLLKESGQGAHTETYFFLLCCKGVVMNFSAD